MNLGDMITGITQAIESSSHENFQRSRTNSGNTLKINQPAKHKPNGRAGVFPCSTSRVVMRFNGKNKS
jgi:hypothetical protein